MIYRRSIDLFLPMLYILGSLPVFLKVYRTSTQVIDEEFHLRQAKHYCAGNFGKWDPKITTLPGLYLITTILLPLKFCTTFNLRMTNLFFAALNLYLIRQILSFLNGRNKKYIFAAINISILPPMYFFGHLYYTDVVSITSVLGLYYFWLKKMHKSAAFFGFWSILIRQTNIIWIAMFLGISTINFLTQNFKMRTKKKHDKDKIFSEAIKWHVMNLNEFMFFVHSIIKIFWPYIFVILMFVAFVILNGSIVVGDKTAHVATLHLPQIFYFSLFTIIFGFPILLPKLIPTLQIIIKNKLFFIALFSLFFIIVKYNTLEHSYLLADNRHYTFYIWSRFYSKYGSFRYLVIPIYIIGLILMHESIKHRGFNFITMFSLATSVVLCLQNLLEVRYFLIPFLIFRLNIRINNNWVLILETFNYLLFNILTFYIFFTKEIYWIDFDNVQRLIW